MKFLIHILKYNNVVKDALRELGFIEVLIARLHQFATLLKESIQDPNGISTFSSRLEFNHFLRLDLGDHLDQGEKELGFMVMEALALLLSHNQKNASTTSRCDSFRLMNIFVFQKSFANTAAPD